MSEWYIICGSMDDGCRKYSTEAIVCADTVKEAQMKVKNYLEVDADCLFTPTNASRLDKDKIY